MKDHRIKVFQAALEAIIESLDAAIRIARWPEGDAPPGSLSLAAGQLAGRLGAADRLRAGVFVGSPLHTKRVAGLCARMKELEAAYLVYRKHLATRPEQVALAAADLEAILGKVALDPA